MKHDKILVVADPHLESTVDDVRYMVDFLRTIKPNVHKLVFLGDLFHVWVESPAYHTKRVQFLMEELAAFRRQGGETHLVVGNRDLFFKNRNSFSEASRLPFDSVHLDFLTIPWANGSIMAHHGDTVNRKDKRYLQWRKIVRSPLVKYLFNQLPAKRVKTLLWDLESRIKQTNLQFRHFFPDAQWVQFVKQVHDTHAPTILMVGHFHPPSPVVINHHTTTGIVVPAWHETHDYLIVDSKLNYRFFRYDPLSGANYT